MKLLIRVLLIAMLPSLAAAQERTYRLGALFPSAASEALTRRLTLSELAKLGFVEGRNLVVEARVGDTATLPALARELVQARPDAIVAIGGDAIRTVSAATKTVPIVQFGGDPLAQGLAASLARPGGNLTGVVVFSSETDGKRLDLLHQAVPAARRVAALVHPSAPSRPASERAMRAVAAKIGVELLPFEAAGPEQYPGAFAAMHAAGAQALVIMASPFFYRDGERLALLALAAGLPTACEWADMARRGCLFGYGPSRAELRRRMAHQIARIFRGERPATIPIEAATRYGFVINLKTARALGITISPMLLARADEVIE